jgi:sec-independent protein translocase protein TatA
MGELSPWHWAIVIGIAVLLFGAKRLPDAARSLGRSARILKAELRADTPTAPAAGTEAPPADTAAPAVVASSAAAADVPGAPDAEVTAEAAATKGTSTA